MLLYKLLYIDLYRLLRFIILIDLRFKIVDLRSNSSTVHIFDTSPKLKFILRLLRRKNTCYGRDFLVISECE